MLGWARNSQVFYYSIISSKMSPHSIASFGPQCQSIPRALSFLASLLFSSFGFALAFLIGLAFASLIGLGRVALFSLDALPLHNPSAQNHAGAKGSG